MTILPERKRIVVNANVYSDGFFKFQCVGRGIPIGHKYGMISAVGHCVNRFLVQNGSTATEINVPNLKYRLKVNIFYENHKNHEKLALCAYDF